jgi:hypothetical protein
VRFLNLDDGGVFFLLLRRLLYRCMTRDRVARQRRDSKVFKASSGWRADQADRIGRGTGEAWVKRDARQDWKRWKQVAGTGRL